MRFALSSMMALVACGGRLSTEMPPPPNEDAGRDAATSDAVAPSDGGNTTTSDGALSPDSWCGQSFPYGVAMCDDFDLLTTPKPEWTASGSGLVVVDSPNVSAPHGLHVVAAPGTGSFLSFTPQKPAIESKFQAEVQVVADGAATTTTEPVVFGLRCEGGQTLSVVLVPGTSNAHCLDTGFAGSATFAPFSFARGAWHSMTLKLSVNQDGTYNPICEVDGVDHGRGSATAVGTPVGNMTAIIGFTATTTQEIDAYYDNVADDVMQ